MAGTAEATGAWLHGVVPSLDPAALDGLAGMDGVRLSVVRAAGLTAVVSDVPLSRYGEEPLRQNLEDMAWLESAARAHHVVVDALSHAGPVVPARLATVYLDTSRVAELLTDRRDVFVEGLDRVAGRAEWGVKAYGRETAEAGPKRPAESGLAYLRQRRAQLNAENESVESAAREATAVHDSLGRIAAAARRHPPQDRRLSGAETPMVLNGSYLVDKDRVTEFRELLSALSERHAAIRLELTGPWPPYSFIADETPAR